MRDPDPRLWKTLEKQSWLFKGFSAGEIEKLLQGIPYQVNPYAKKEAIFRPLETADHIGVILKGSVQSYKLFPNGNQINVAKRKAGDLIGAAASLSAQGMFPFGVVALEDTRLLLFQRKDYLRLLQRDDRLVKNALSELSTITYMLQQRLELLSYHGIDQKIAFYLLSEALQKDISTIPIPGSMTRWALMMNVSRPSLYRELKKLEDQGMVRIRPKEIEIADYAALESILLS